MLPWTGGGGGVSAVNDAQTPLLQISGKQLDNERNQLLQQPLVLTLPGGMHFHSLPAVAVGEMSH